MSAHLPCPALADWLPGLFGAAAEPVIGLWIRARMGREMTRWLNTMRAGSSQFVAIEDGAACVDGALLIVDFGREDLPPWENIQLRPGGYLVELGVLPRASIRELLGIRRDPLRLAERGQARVGHYLQRGFHELQQWTGVDPRGVVVTVARAR